MFQNYIVTNERRASRTIYTEYGMRRVGPGETLSLSLSEIIADEEAAVDGLTVAPENGELSNRTIAQLRDLADGREIDLGDATKKADIIAIIAAAE